MKKNFVIATLSMGFAAFAQTAPGQAPANQPPAAPPAQTQAAQKPAMPPTILGKIAVIRTQQAIMLTKEGQAANAALTAKFEPKKTEFAKREGGIQELQDQLKKGGATMSDEAKQKLQRDIEAKTKSYERDIQDANDDLDQEMGKVMNDIGNKMVGVIISQYAAQNGYAAVFDVSNNGNGGVLWAAPSTDITADIIKLYDQTYPATGAPKPAVSSPPKSLPPSQVKK